MVEILATLVILAVRRQGQSFNFKSKMLTLIVAISEKLTNVILISFNSAITWTFSDNIKILFQLHKQERFYFLSLLTISP